MSCKRTNYFPKNNCDYDVGVVIARSLARELTRLRARSLPALQTALREAFNLHMQIFARALSNGATRTLITGRSLTFRKYGRTAWRAAWRMIELTIFLDGGCEILRVLWAMHSNIPRSSDLSSTRRSLTYIPQWRPRNANRAYPKVAPSAPYTPAFMGASRKKVATSEGSNVIFMKYIGHSENMSCGSRFQRCGAR